MDNGILAWTHQLLRRRGEEEEEEEEVALPCFLHMRSRLGQWIMVPGLDASVTASTQNTSGSMDSSSTAVTVLVGAYEESRPAKKPNRPPRRGAR